MHFLCCDKAIRTWNFEQHNFLWISKPFSVKENSICDDDMTAKIESLQLPEDACLKTDLTKENIRKFRADTGKLLLT